MWLWWCKHFSVTCSVLFFSFKPSFPYWRDSTQCVSGKCLWMSFHWKWKNWLNHLKSFCCRNTWTMERTMLCTWQWSGQKPAVNCSEQLLNSFYMSDRSGQRWRKQGFFKHKLLLLKTFINYSFIHFNKLLLRINQAHKMLLHLYFVNEYKAVFARCL